MVYNKCLCDVCKFAWYVTGLLLVQTTGRLSDQRAVSNSWVHVFEVKPMLQCNLTKTTDCQAVYLYFTRVTHIIVYIKCTCTDIGAEFGDVRPLDKAHMRALTVNGIQLLKLIDSNCEFLAELASPTVGAITWHQREHLVELVHSRDRNDKLLEFITRRSVADYQKFTTVLSKYQHFLVPLLLTDAGEMLLAVLVKLQQSLFINYWYRIK